MIFYEVTVEVREDLVQRFESYMRQKHIPEILASKCFVEIRFDQATETLYRTCYLAATQEDYERYLADYAADFRFDFLQQFPDGCTVSRLVLNDLQTWKNQTGEEKFF